MKGIVLSEKYWNEFGLPAINEQFPEIRDLLCAGLCGSGSECFGFDDEVSHDHDFGPGFCLFIPDDVIDEKTEFRLERMYAHLPKEYMGFARQRISPVGGNRLGVLKYSDFFTSKCGSPDGELIPAQWLTLPESSLAEAVNGVIFFDPLGMVTQIREKLAFYPDDVFLKKLAGALLMMAQAGQYNYNRCVKRGDPAAAQMCAAEFVRAAINAAHLLSGRYTPYYKWQFRSLSELVRFSSLAERLLFLISTDNEEAACEVKSDIIEEVACVFIDALRERRLTDAVCGDLEKHAYSVNDRIRDPGVRNMNIFAGV